MPIRRGSVSFARFRLSAAAPKDAKRWLQKGLRRKAFEPIDVRGDDERTAGFVELEAPDAAAFEVGGLFLGLHALFSWREDKLRVPPAQLRAQLSRWATDFEAQHGRPPGRREKAEQKDTARKALRKSLAPTTKLSEVSLDLASGDVFVWASSRRVVEEVQAALEEALERRLHMRAPAAFVDEATLDALTPTAALFVEVR